MEGQRDGQMDRYVLKQASRNVNAKLQVVGRLKITTNFFNCIFEFFHKKILEENEKHYKTKKTKKPKKQTPHKN